MRFLRLPAAIVAITAAAGLFLSCEKKPARRAIAPQLTWNPGRIVSQLDHVFYAGRYVVTHGERAVTAWNVDTGNVSPIQLAHYGQDPPGVWQWSGMDTYQFVTVIDASAEYVITNVWNEINWTRDGTVSSPDHASGVQVMKFAPTGLVYHGQIAIDGVSTTNSLAIDGHHANVLLFSGGCAKVDLANLLVIDSSMPCPADTTPIQSTIDGYTYRHSASGTTHTLTRSDQPSPTSPPQPTLPPAPTAVPVPTYNPTFIASPIPSPGEICRRGFQCYDCITLVEVTCPGLPTPVPVPEDDELALGQGGRFRVKVTWRALDGRIGRGVPVPLKRDTGAFWFFDQENLELVIKVLDGRQWNGHFWVFYGALSNVEYSIVVLDAVTGRSNLYFNPQGTFASKGDTEAFPAPLGRRK